tara:strand:- start:416 stop:703 length:288 start_codon:yes stop_codon:yes gene_type:complete
MKRATRRKINFAGNEPCEICNVQEYLVQHHIRGRKIKDANNPFNLTNICSNCHTKVHHGIIIVEKKCMTTDGIKLIWHYYKDETITGDNAAVHLL